MIKETICCNCGIIILIEEDFLKYLKENHKTFYCLNGHGQSFVSKTDAEIQRELKEKFEKENSELRFELQKLKGDIKIAENQKKLTKEEKEAKKKKKK